MDMEFNAEDLAFRRRGTGAAARRRDHPLAAGLNHPIYDSVRQWADRIGNAPSLDLLNFCSEEKLLPDSCRD